MTLRRCLLGIASAALAILLILLLVRVGRIDFRTTLQQLRSVSFISFTKLLLLNCLLVYLSTEKWRTIDAAWRRPCDTSPSMTTAFAHTSVGFALGILLPVQLAMSTVRTFGTHFHGKALKRGTAGTLFEQGFDVLTVGLLALASGLTYFYRGGGIMWTALAVAATVLGLLAAGPSVGALRWLAVACSASVTGHTNRLKTLIGSLSDLRHSGLLDARVARRLLMLSTLRFCVVVLMSIETAESIGVHIPLWQMAASIPFVVIASVIALTPGGLGVNELTSVTALKVFGTPLAVGAQWALANRVLIAVSYFSIASCALILVGAEKIVFPSARNAMQER